MRIGIIDRYLLRQFLQTFLICFLSLTGLYIVFDAFTNLENFLDCADEAGGLARLMGKFYVYRAFFFFDLTAGMITLIAAMFTITWIQRHNEMTALMAAGVSRVRVALPVILAAVSVAGLATVNRELIIPSFRRELNRSPSDLIGKTAKRLDPHSDALTDVYIRGEATMAQDQRIVHPNFLLPDGQQIEAQNAFYREPQGDRPGGYLLVGIVQPKGLAEQPSLAIGGRPVLITPRDAPDWLKPDQCFVVSGVPFDQLTEGMTYASTAQLIAGLRNPSLNFGSDMRVEIHARIVRPLLDVTILFLGLPLVLTRESRNVFIAIGLCVLVVSVFVGVVLTMQYLGAACLLSPPLAAWAPLILFVPVATAMASGMGK